MHVKYCSIIFVRNYELNVANLFSSCRLGKTQFFVGFCILKGSSTKDYIYLCELLNGRETLHIQLSFFRDSSFVLPPNKFHTFLFPASTL